VNVVPFTRRSAGPTQDGDAATVGEAAGDSDGVAKTVGVAVAGAAVTVGLHAATMPASEIDRVNTTMVRFMAISSEQGRNRLETPVS
jgi:hypothetical protein